MRMRPQTAPTPRSNSRRLSAIQEVERDFGIPVISIVSLNQVLEFLADDPQLKQHLPAVEAYRAQFGV